MDVEYYGPEAENDQRWGKRDEKHGGRVGETKRTLIRKPYC